MRNEESKMSDEYLGVSLWQGRNTIAHRLDTSIPMGTVSGACLAT